MTFANLFFVLLISGCLGGFGGRGGIQVSVSSGNVKNYMHAPRGLGGRRMKASERGSQASASKAVGWCVACRHSEQ